MSKNRGKEHKDMVAQAVQEEGCQESDFLILLSRFQQKKENDHEVEASIIQMNILAKHGTWVD